MHTRLTGALRWSAMLVSLASVLGWAALACAQEEPPRPPDAPAEEAPREDQAAPEMQEMARALKSMADMCQMMMRREMASRPYTIAAGVALGSLLVIALVLFIILEVQWIRFWSVRIKTERKHLG